MRLYNKIADRLAGLGSDKYLHFIVCLLITFAVAKISRGLLPAGWASVAGVSISCIAGFCKEIRDRHQPGNEFSWGDIIADLTGAMTGAVMSL